MTEHYPFDAMPFSATGTSYSGSLVRDPIIGRIEKDAGVPGLADILSQIIPPTDLQSLLSEVYRRRAKKREPRDLLGDHVSSRFTRPSSCNPLHLLEWDLLAFSLLPRTFETIELSPICPLGTASVLSPINQDWTVSTIRNTEVVADSTNVLALECAIRRCKQKEFSSGKAASIHLAASHRLLRGQRFGVGPGIRPHFRALALCSAGRDLGNLRFEIESLRLHIGYYLKALRRFLGPKITLRVAISDFGSDSIRSVIRSGMEKVSSSHKKVGIGFDQGRRQGRGYYGEMCFKIFATLSTGREHELIDGGDVNWTQKLLNNRKERLIISGCGSERLCELLPSRKSRMKA